MASEFERVFTDLGFPKLRDTMGEALTFTATDGTDYTVTIIGDRQLGFVDEFGRKTFTFAEDDLPVEATRLARITDSTGTYTVLDIAADQGIYEIRADLVEDIN